MTYDKLGRMKPYTDGRCAMREYRHDKLDRVLEIEARPVAGAPIEFTTTFVYDGQRQP